MVKLQIIEDRGGWSWGLYRDGELQMSFLLADKARAIAAKSQLEAQMNDDKSRVGQGHKAEQVSVPPSQEVLPSALWQLIETRDLHALARQL